MLQHNILTEEILYYTYKVLLLQMWVDLTDNVFNICGLCVSVVSRSTVCVNLHDKSTSDTLLDCSVSKLKFLTKVQHSENTMQKYIIDELNTVDERLFS